MKVYCGISPRRKYQVFYSPQEFLVYESAYLGSLVEVHWNDSFFNEVYQRFFEGKLSIDKLEDAGWVIKEMDIPEKESQGYRKKCLKAQRLSDDSNMRDVMRKNIVTLVVSLLPKIESLKQVI